MTDEETALVALAGWPMPDLRCTFYAHCKHVARRRPSPETDKTARLCLCCAQTQPYEVLGGITPYLYTCDGIPNLTVLADARMASPP